MASLVDTCKLGSRDLTGYGRDYPSADWPEGAKIAVSFVLNYEEGAELSLDNGDPTSESDLVEWHGTQKRAARDPLVESEYEYGSRKGVWRILNLLEAHKMPMTIYAVAQALEKNPEATKAFVDGGHEVASHAYRWLNYRDLSIETEKEYVQKAIDSFKKTLGFVPKGWYYGRNSEYGRALVAQVYKENQCELKWEADAYNDDIPYYVPYPNTPKEEDNGLLIIPYSFDNNDLKFCVPNGFSCAEDMFIHLRDSFDTLYEEGLAGKAGMMSIGLHCRLVGKPGRITALKKFIEYIETKPGVWVTTREKIADHWRSKFPYTKE